MQFRAHQLRVFAPNCPLVTSAIEADCRGNQQQLKDRSVLCASWTTRGAVKAVAYFFVHEARQKPTLRIRTWTWLHLPGSRSIAGHVWPSTAVNDVALSAVLNDGTHIEGQHRLTALGDVDSATGVREIALSAGDGAAVPANEAVIESLESADAIVFGPGSFFTSVLPHFLVDGIVPAIVRNVHARRVFLGNILQCRETRGMDVARMVEVAAGVWQAQGGADVRPFTHVLANRQILPFEKTAGSFAYLGTEALEATGARLGAEVVIGEFEDPWQRGHHDGRVLADALSALLP